MSRLDFLGRRRVMNGSKIDLATQLMNNRKTKIDSLLAEKKFGKKKKTRRNYGLKAVAPLRNNILKPISKGSGEGNELDKLLKDDPLLKGKDTKYNKEEILQETPKVNEPDTVTKESDGKQDTNQIIEETIRNLKSSNESDQLKGATSVKNYNEVWATAERYIEAGVVPLLVSLLEIDDNSPLQVEALWALTNISAGPSEDIDTMLDADALPQIKRILTTSTNDKVLEQAVWCIGNIVGDSGDHRDAVLGIGMVPILEKLVPKLDSVESQRVMAWTFCNMFRNEPILNMSDEDWDTCLRYLKHYINVEDKETKGDAFWGISYSTARDDGGIQRTLDLGILDILSDIFDHHEDYKFIMAPLRIIGNLVYGTHDQTDVVVQANFIPKIVKLLESPKQNLVKEALWALSNILSDSEDHIQQVIDSKALPVIIEKLTIAENFLHPVAKEAVWCISNCAINGNEKQAEELMLAGGFDALICFLKADTKHVDRVVAIEGCIKLIEKAPLEEKILEGDENIESIVQHLVDQDIPEAEQLMEKIHEIIEKDSLSTSEDIDGSPS